MVRPLPLRSSLVALAVGVWCARGGEAWAQPQPARPTGIFFRVGPSLSGFDLDMMTFRRQGRPTDAPPSFSGKQLGLGREWLPGVSGSIHLDGAWFWVRVGADVYAPPSGHSHELATSAEARVDSLSMGWIAAGPRFVFGRFSAQAGLRVGAVLMDVSYRDAGRARDYTGLGAFYAIDVGAQWRPLRWLQVDVNAGQDVLGALLATTFGVNVNLGWSGAPR